MVSLESGLSAHARPRKWRKRVSARRLYTIFTVCYSRGKGLLDFKYHISSKPIPANIVKVERFSKEPVNALTKLDHMTLWLHFHLSLSYECEDWPRIGHLIA